MSDLIDRAAAIDAVEHITSSMSVCVNTDECYGMKRMQRRAVIELTNLPSVQPERKTGEWLMKPDPYAFFDEIPVCSECGHTTKMREKYNFCPNCGADMRGEQDGSD